MELYTKRLILRPWRETDAESLYKLAEDPAIGPPAGWCPHTSVEESKEVIRTIFNGPECYAICLLREDAPIGCIELKLNGSSNLTKNNDECEMGFWIGREYWGQGLVPEAAEELLRHAFGELNMRIVWCGYYEGNEKSQRTQEKIGFSPAYSDTVEVPFMGEFRDENVTYISKEQWTARRHSGFPDQ